MTGIERVDVDPREAGWSLGVRLLHWLTVIVLAGQLVVAFFLFGPGMATHIWMPVHISLGTSIFGIAIIRLVWRLSEKAPRRAGSLVLERLGSVVHGGLYMLILAVVTTGWMAFRPAPFMPTARLFGFVPVPVAPSLPGLSGRDLASVHSFLVWMLIAFITAHTAAALTHLLILKDRVVEGMIAGRRDRQASRQSPR